MRADARGYPLWPRAPKLYSRAGYRCARPIPSIAHIGLATHGRSIQIGSTHSHNSARSGSQIRVELTLCAGCWPPSFSSYSATAYAAMPRHCTLLQTRSNISRLLTFLSLPFVNVKYHASPLTRSMLPVTPRSPGIVLSPPNRMFTSSALSTWANTESPDTVTVRSRMLMVSPIFLTGRRGAAAFGLQRRTASNLCWFAACSGGLFHRLHLYGWERGIVAGPESTGHGCTVASVSAEDPHPCRCEPRSPWQASSWPARTPACRVGRRSRTREGR
jgi:hypothetical protein